MKTENRYDPQKKSKITKSFKNEMQNIYSPLTPVIKQT